MKTNLGRRNTPRCNQPREAARGRCRALIRRIFALVAVACLHVGGSAVAQTEIVSGVATSTGNGQDPFATYNNSNNSTSYSISGNVIGPSGSSAAVSVSYGMIHVDAHALGFNEDYTATGRFNQYVTINPMNSALIGTQGTARFSWNLNSSISASSDNQGTYDWGVSTIVFATPLSLPILSLVTVVVM